MRPFRSFLPIGMALVVGFALSACTSSGSGGRSMIGAGLDALSSLTGRGQAERSAALIESGVDAVGSSEADSYMGQQEAALQAELAPRGAKITRAGERIIIMIPSSSAFNANGDDITKSAQPVLDAAAGVLKNSTARRSTFMDIRIVAAAKRRTRSYAASGIGRRHLSGETRYR
jgi:hypothetical protein